MRFGKQTIVAGEFLFEQLLDFHICFIKPVFVFPCRQANNFSRGFPWYGLHLLSLFLRPCSFHTVESFLQRDLEIGFLPLVTKCVPDWLPTKTAEPSLPKDVWLFRRSRFSFSPNFEAHVRRLNASATGPHDN